MYILDLTIFSGILIIFDQTGLTVDGSAKEIRYVMFSTPRICLEVISYSGGKKTRNISGCIVNALGTSFLKNIMSIGQSSSRLT